MKKGSLAVKYSFDDIWVRYKDIHGWCLEEKARYLHNHIIKTDPELVMEIGIFGGKSFLPIVEAVKENDIRRNLGTTSVSLYTDLPAPTSVGAPGSLYLVTSTDKLYWCNGEVWVSLGNKNRNSGICIGLEPWESGPATEGDNGKDADEWWGAIDGRTWAGIMGVFYDLARTSNLIDLMEVYRTTSKDFLPVFTDMNRKLDLLHIDGNHSTEQAMYDVVNYTPFIKSGGYLVMDDMDWPSLETVIEYIERTLKYEWVDAITHNGNRCSCGIYRKVK
jgi:hypothetical protein